MQTAGRHFRRANARGARRSLRSVFGAQHAIREQQSADETMRMQVIKDAIAVENDSATMMVKDLQEEIKKIREGCKQEIFNIASDVDKCLSGRTLAKDMGVPVSVLEHTRDDHSQAMKKTGPADVKFEGSVETTKHDPEAKDMREPLTERKKDTLTDIVEKGTLKDTGVMIGKSENTDTDNKVPGMKVLLRGLKANPELNGLEGILHKFDNIKGRWQTMLKSGKFVEVKPENLDVDIQPLREPLRPCSAYRQFCADNKEDATRAAGTDIVLRMKMLGTTWRESSDAIKKHYEMQAENEMQKYEEDLQKYKDGIFCSAQSRGNILFLNTINHLRKFIPTQLRTSGNNISDQILVDILIAASHPRQHHPPQVLSRPGLALAPETPEAAAPQMGGRPNPGESQASLQFCALGLTGLPMLQRGKRKRKGSFGN